MQTAALVRHELLRDRVLKLQCLTVIHAHVDLLHKADGATLMYALLQAHAHWQYRCSGTDNKRMIRAPKL
jgi:hypothetical protein